MKVIHLSVECFPVAKVGGLADVVGALPKYLRKLAIDVSVVMPWYDRPFIHQNSLNLIYEGTFWQGATPLFYQILGVDESILGFPLYFIKIPGKLDRKEVYCYSDEAEQWLAFQHALLHWLCAQQIKPDILHCHDHHVGLIPFFVKNCAEFNFLKETKTICTVHNGQYQGWLNWNKSMLFPHFDTWKWGLLDWDGMINPLATAIKCADAYTTVSEGYLLELYAKANGLEKLFFDEREKSYGIVNGIDTEYWNPQTDALIPYHYHLKAIADGKKKNKIRFCEKADLDEKKPLLCFIGRFAQEKGADLLSGIIWSLLTQNTEISIFILGSGDEKIQQDIAHLLDQFPHQIAVYFGYNEALAHEVYAASDMLLMPSWVEPCGLNQMYALKYGTIPIVRNIGGLKDTVIDIEQEDGYGFTFQDLNVHAAVNAVQRACFYYTQKRKWERIRAKAMKLDFSWENSAKKYVSLYKQTI